MTTGILPSAAARAAPFAPLSRRSVVRLFFLKQGFCSPAESGLLFGITPGIHAARCCAAGCAALLFVCF